VILDADPSKERSAKIYKHRIKTSEAFPSAIQSILQAANEENDGLMTKHWTN